MIYFSIRKRLLLWIFLSMILILSGMGLAAHFVTEHESEEIFSARLATSARVLEVLTAKQLEHATITNPIIIELPDELEHQHSSTEEISGHPYESKISFQIWHSNGKLLAKSATAPDKPLGPMTEGFGKNLIGDDLWQVFQLKSGDVWVMVAEMDSVRGEMAGDLGVAIMTPLIIGSLLLLIVINVIAYRSFQPLQALANVIEHGLHPQAQLLQRLHGSVGDSIQIGSPGWIGWGQSGGRFRTQAALGWVRRRSTAWGWVHVPQSTVLDILKPDPSGLWGQLWRIGALSGDNSRLSPLVPPPWCAARPQAPGERADPAPPFEIRNVRLL
jgi:hypothetical protein